MAQSRLGPIDGAAVDGDDLIDLLEDFEDSVVSGYIGTTRPTWLTAGGTWTKRDPDSSPRYIRMLWTGAHNVPIAEIDTSDSTQITKVAVSSAGTTYLASIPGTTAIEGIVNSNRLLHMSATGLAVSTGTTATTEATEAERVLDLGRDTGAMRVPRGTTAQEPTDGEKGDLRFDTDTNKFRGHDGTQWADIGSGAGGGLDRDQVEDAVATMVGTGGAGITVTYSSNADNVGTLTITNDITSTDDLTEGTTNLFFTDSRVDNRIDSTFRAGVGLSTIRDASNNLELSVSAAEFEGRGGITISESGGRIRISHDGNNLTTQGAIDNRVKTLVKAGDGLRTDPASGTLTKLSVDFDETGAGKTFKNEVADHIGEHVILHSNVAGMVVQYDKTNRQLRMALEPIRNDRLRVTAGAQSPRVGQVLTAGQGLDFQWQDGAPAVIGSNTITTDKIAGLTSTTIGFLQADGDGTISVGTPSGGGGGTDNLIVGTTGITATTVGSVTTVGLAVAANQIGGVREGGDMEIDASGNITLANSVVGWEQINAGSFTNGQVLSVSGTSLDWVDPQSGPQGPQGIQGTAGVQGPIGPKGDKGDPGDPAAITISAGAGVTRSVSGTVTTIGLDVASQSEAENAVDNTKPMTALRTQQFHEETWKSFNLTGYTWIASGDPSAGQYRVSNGVLYFMPKSGSDTSNAADILKDGLDVTVTDSGGLVLVGEISTFAVDGGSGFYTLTMRSPYNGRGSGSGQADILLEGTSAHNSRSLSSTTLFAGDNVTLTKTESSVTISATAGGGVTAGTGIAVSGTTVSISGGGVDTAQLADGAATFAKMDMGTSSGASVRIVGTTGTSQGTPSLMRLSAGSNVTISHQEVAGSLDTVTISASGGGGGGGGGVTWSQTAPSNPSDGQLWADSDNARLAAYYDADSVWVGLGGGGSGGGGGIGSVTAGTGITSATWGDGVRISTNIVAGSNISTMVSAQGSLTISATASSGGGGGKTHLSTTALTSGSNIDVDEIPSSANEVTILLYRARNGWTSGTAIDMQARTSAGVITTGYQNTNGSIGTSAGRGGGTSNFSLYAPNTNQGYITGTIILRRFAASSNIWIFEASARINSSQTGHNTTNNAFAFTAGNFDTGSNSLAGIRFISPSGSWSAGSASIWYQ